MINKSKKFVIDIFDKRTILLELAKRDFQKQYMGSYLGFIWVYLQPLLFISVLYAVFTFGLRVNSNMQGEAPFSVYLISGIIAWFYFAGNLSAATNVIQQNSFILKKVDFRISMLPIVKLLSSILPHFFFIFIAIIVAALNGIYPSFYILQLIYYIVAMVFLLLGISWFTSSTNLFVPDVSKIISIIITFGFWLTPIFWNISRIPDKYQWIIKLNPAVYIVEGYRDSIINKIGFWEKPYQSLYFWTITILCLWLGITIFKKLRPHFAEVA